MKKFLILALIAGAGMFYSCDDEPIGTKGCTDSTATNYNANATEDDGSCTYNNSGGAGGSGSGSGSGSGISDKVKIIFHVPYASRKHLPVEITLNGTKRTLSESRSSSVDCSSTVDVIVFKVDAGSGYNYSWSTSTGQSSSKSRTAPPAGQCTTIQIG